MLLIGFSLALISALGTNVAFLLKHRGAAAAPAMQLRHPLRSAAHLLRSRLFWMGWVVAIGAWIVHIGAIAIAPLSIVQAVLSAGLVFLAVLGERYFGLHLGRRQWAGLSVITAGLILIGVTNGQIGSYHYNSAALIAVEASIFFVGLLCIAASLHGRCSDKSKALFLGLASGALFGVSDIALKYISHALGGGILAIISPWTLTALLAALITFYTSARSFQLGAAVEVIALTSISANLVAILGGILVFHDPIGHGALEIIGRSLAFFLVLAGTALVPAPVRVRQQQI